MRSATPFRETFEQILRKHLRLLTAAEPIERDACLVSEGLDSLGTINLLLDIETTFAIAFPAALLTPDTFRTRASLERVVAALVGGT
jgi:acyl carrier protein